MRRAWLPDSTEWLATCLAQDTGARVKAFASPHYRPDFIAYRELPGLG